MTQRGLGLNLSTKDSIRKGSCRGREKRVEVLIRIDHLQNQAIQRENRTDGDLRRKPGHRVTNAHAYNQSLKRRSMISLYFCGTDLKAQFVNAGTHMSGVSGRGPTCTKAYIEPISVYDRLFG